MTTTIEKPHPVYEKIAEVNKELDSLLAYKDNPATELMEKTNPLFQYKCNEEPTANEIKFLKDLQSMKQRRLAKQ